MPQERLLERMSKARTNLFCTLIVSFFLSLHLSAQNAPTSQRQPPPVDLQNTLAKVDQTAQAAALDLARLRIEKWKADGREKQQAQSNAESLQRNLTAALPTLTAAVRNSPQDFGANFKLYRNLSALNDVLKTLTESAGAFGPKQDFESLAQYAEAFDDYRRTLGDYLENLAVAKEAELNRLRAQARGAQSNVAPAPKKVIVDDDQPAPKKKAPRKKPPAPSTPPATPPTTPK
jgi:hypothetical protein